MHRFARAALGAATILGVVTFVPADIVIAEPNDETAPVFVSEIHYDNTGTDAGEAVEVFGPAGTDLTGWSIVLYNGSIPASAVVYDTDPLVGTIPDLVGGFGVVTVSYPANGIQNGAPDGLALVDATGGVVQFLSYEGEMTAAGGPAVGLTSTDIGVSQNGSGAVGNSLQLVGEGPCVGMLEWAAEAVNTFGQVGLIDPSGECVVGPPPDPVLTSIHDVQGAGAASPIVGTTVIVEGVVVGDHEGPSPALRGFFVQEEDVDADADPATSEGLFVFNGDLDSVAVGQRVSVTGTVAEFDGLTELTSATTTVLGEADSMPSPATIQFPVNALTDLEAFEGMVGTLLQEMVISEYFNYDRFGEIVVALPAPGEERPMSPTALFAPESAEAAARADLNARSRITIDDAITSQNPANVVHPITRDLFTLDNAFRGGDKVTGLTGPITFAFGLYRILPYGDGAGYASYEKTVAPAAPEAVGGSVRVAAMNTLNYFLTIDTTPSDAAGTPGPCGALATLDCRGADSVEEFDRQRVRLLNALEGLDADVIGLNELENTPGVEPLADISAGLDERFGAGTYEHVVAGSNSVVGSDAIKVGMVYRPGAVTPIGPAAVLDTPEFVNPLGGEFDRSRPAVAQTFRDNATGEVFSVVVNHLKSKGSACPEEGVTPGLAGNCDIVRTLAAQALVDWIATSPTGVDDDDWLIMGDLNSYDHEAPIGVLETAGFTDLPKLFHGEYAYSYVFDGQAGYLDHALASQSLLPQVTGITDWHINSDEPDLLDYDTSFKSDYQDTLFDPESPARASDHDAVVVGLELDSGVSFRATPDTLWLPLHQLVPIRLSARDDMGTRFEVDAIDGESSEADSGLGRFDRPNDIVIDDDGDLRVRAEVFGCPLRTYTIDTSASGGGQVVYGTVTVDVVNLLGWLFGCR